MFDLVTRIFVILSVISVVELTTCVTKNEKKQKSLYDRHGFDAYYSNKFVPLQRNLPDFRSEWCKSQSSELDFKTTVSIIICFHNEVSYTSIKDTKILV